MKSLTDLAGNLDSSTAQVLTALRIVATRADVEEVVEWAAKELEGYQMEDDLPPHRSWSLTIKANLVNPIGTAMMGVHMGELAIEEQHRKTVTICYCRDGIEQIEGMLSEVRNQILGVEHPNLTQLINAGPMIGKGWTCTHATAEFSPIHLRTIISKARQTALGFCLECERNGVDLRWGDDDQTEPGERAKWLSKIKEEGTKLILRTAWESTWKSLTGGG